MKLHPWLLFLTPAFAMIKQETREIELPVNYQTVHNLQVPEQKVNETMYKLMYKCNQKNDKFEGIVTKPRDSSGRAPIVQSQEHQGNTTEF